MLKLSRYQRDRLREIILSNYDDNGKELIDSYLKLPNASPLALIYFITGDHKGQCNFRGKHPAILYILDQVDDVEVMRKCSALIGFWKVGYQFKFFDEITERNIVAALSIGRYAELEYALEFDTIEKRIRLTLKYLATRRVNSQNWPQELIRKSIFIFIEFARENRYIFINYDVWRNLEAILESLGERGLQTKFTIVHYGDLSAEQYQKSIDAVCNSVCEISERFIDLQQFDKFYEMIKKASELSKWLSSALMRMDELRKKYSN